MKRQEKFPDTKTFKFYNANPKNKITGDCVIRALSTAMELPYHQLYDELYQFSLKCGYMLNDKKCYEKYLAQKGWVKQKQPRKKDNTKYTGKEFCEEIQTHRHWYSPNIIAKIGSHHIVAIMYGQVNDIWDSTSYCIGNFWEYKPNK